MLLATALTRVFEVQLPVGQLQRKHARERLPATARLLAALSLALLSTACPAPATSAGHGAVDSGTRDGGSSDAGADGGSGADAGVYFCDLPGELAGATVPDGFCVRRFAQVKTPRVLAFAPNGDLFVASPKAQTPGGASPGLGGVYVLSDDDHDGVADAPAQYVAGAAYETVHGLLVHGDTLTYTLDHGVYSVPYHAGDRALAAGVTATQLADLSPLPNERFTHTLAMDAAGQLYVSRGQYDNETCPPADPRVGGVLAIGPGHDVHGDVVVTGLRNPMYLSCAAWPSCTAAGCVKSACYANELTGDNWDTLGGSEKLIEVHAGDDFGYPCCANRDVPAVAGADCSRTSVQITSFPLHATPFGLDWDLGNAFPAPYGGGLFIAFHGVVGSWVGTGIRWAPLDPATHHPSADFTNFLGGWGLGGPIRGRVADVRFAPDGRLFFADDEGGAVYWIAPRTMKRVAN